MELCSRCHKRMAVVFITRIENDKTINEGICLKCARELGIPQISNIMNNMGMTDEETSDLTYEMARSGDMLDLSSFGDLSVAATGGAGLNTSNWKRSMPLVSSTP